MNQTECKLQMLDLYFSRFDFSQERGKNSTEYSSSFNIEYSVSSNDHSKIRVTINTSICSKENEILLNLQTIGLFKVEQIDIEEDVYNQLVKTNTVAIMFPYIRSQVSLLTTQPGIQPIMIPPMNINVLLENNQQSPTQNESTN